jgi:hypothetical protein
VSVELDDEAADDDDDDVDEVARPTTRHGRF